MEDFFFSRDEARWGQNSAHDENVSQWRTVGRDSERAARVAKSKHEQELIAAAPAIRAFAEELGLVAYRVKVHDIDDKLIRRGIIEELAAVTATMIVDPLVDTAFATLEVASREQWLAQRGRTTKAGSSFIH